MGQSDCRYYLDMAPDVEKEVRFLLRQTSNLWNCIISHIGDVLLEVSRSYDADDARTKIKILTDSAFDILILGKNTEPGFTLAPFWKKQLRHVRSLPDEVMQARLRDMVESYCYAQRKFAEGVDWPSVPGLKKEGSTETFCIPPGMWKIVDGDRVVITIGEKVVTVKAAGVSSLVGSPGLDESSLTLTKKRPARIKDARVEKGLKKKPFYLTLSQR